MFFNYKVVA